MLLGFHQDFIRNLRFDQAPALRHPKRASRNSWEWTTRNSNEFTKELQELLRITRALVGSRRLVRANWAVSDTFASCPPSLTPSNYATRKLLNSLGKASSPNRPQNPVSGGSRTP